MLAIELRRNAGPLMVPVLIAAAGLFGWNNLTSPVTLWSDSSVLIRDLAIFAAPFLGGLAAWMAGRERRRGADDLLGTTPRPELARRLTTWTATAAWGLFVYGLLVMVVLVVTYQRATWGAPSIWPISVGALTLPAYAALGYALGYRLPSRFVAPLVAVGLFAGQYLAASPRLPFALLSPAVALDYRVWFGVKPDGIGLPQALLLIGLAMIGLGSLAIRRRMSLSHWGVVLSGVAFVALGVITLPPTNPATATAATPNEGWQRYELIPYEPVCEDGTVTVCVHPAYEPVLEEIAGDVDRIAKPLAGLPGLPDRIEQLPAPSYYA